MRSPVVAIALSLVLVAGCSTPSDTGQPTAGPPTTLAVPGDYASVQDAVDAAEPGDLILIEPGTYNEAVTVETPGIVIRGLDRNDVVFDGEHELTHGIVVNADGVAVENLTVANYRFNGLLFVPAADGGNSNYGTAAGPVLQGYRASFVTAYNNGLYGIYAFNARGGVIEDSYASGHPDSGIYIGQCDPCDAVVRRVVAEYNVVGFQGTNASTELYIVESEFRNNRIGIQPNSDDAEREAPQHDAFVIGNTVADNDSQDTPPSESDNFGYGIALGGSQDTVIARNLVTGNDNTGIVVLGENDGFSAESNTVEGNVLRDNGIDLEFVSPVGRNEGNCFAGNTFVTSLPDEIENLLGCEGPTESVEPSPTSQRIAPPPGVDHTTLPEPPPQPSMPNAATAPARPATGEFEVDIDAIEVPAA